MVLEIIKMAQSEGIQLYVDTGRLKYRARGNPPSVALTNRIKQNKPALIELLSSQRAVQNRDRTLAPTGLDRAPLTPNQARVFYQSAAFPTGDTYVMEVAYRFDGLLKPTRLNAALQKIAERHQILRSRFFVNEDGVPTQQVVADPAACVTLCVDRDQTPDHWLSRRAKVKCDLSKGQVLNAGLLLTADESHLHIACHHIAFDGGSYQTLLAELAHFYNDPSAVLPPLSLQFIDYANFNEAQGWSEASQFYWKGQMDGVSSFNGLPSDKPRGPMGNFSGQSFKRVIPKDIEDPLSALAAANKVSRFSAFLAAFYVQLARYLRTQDCVIGTPLSGRVLSQLDGIIGFFANAVPLRAEVDHDLSFVEFMRRVHKINLMAQQHQDLNVQQLIRELGYAGETAFTPLNQIMFSFEEARDENLILDSHIGQKLPLVRHQAAFDLECSLIKHANGPLEACWVYSDALFEAQTASDFAKTFETTLRQLLANPGLPLKRISLGDRLAPVSQLRTSEDPPPLFIDMFEARAAQFPHAVACKWLDKNGDVTSETYGSLNAKADALVSALRHNGVSSKTPVAVYVEALPETIISLIAIHKIGAAYMVLDPAIPANRCQMMYEQAGCHCAIGSVPPELLPQSTLVISAVQNKNEATPTPSHLAERNLENIAVILFTSGSTGLPKGVKLSQGAIAHFLIAAQKKLSIAQGDCFAVSSTLTFDAHILEIFLALAHGGSIALLDPARARDAAFLSDDQNLLDINFMFATPTSWQLLRDAGWCPQNGMTMVSGGESLSQQLSDDLLTSAQDLRLLNVYGPSEATVFNLCTFMQVGTPVHLGTILSGNHVYLQDPYGHACPPSCRGEIIISGPQVGQGYLRPQAGFFLGANGWSYATGDIARQGPDGRFIMVGREDFQVKINGVRLELDEISIALERHPLINRAAVVVDQRDGGLAAFVETDLDQNTATSQLMRFLATQLPRSHLPSSFTVLGQMPLTQSGKINRKALPAPAIKTINAVGRAPKTAMEFQICEIWSALLERTVSDVDAGFFELGGHSLLAIKMINRVNRTCGTDLKMRDVVGALSVADLVSRVEETIRVDTTTKLIPFQQKLLPAPLSFSQERIWILDQIEASDSNYTIPLIFEIQGPEFDHKTATNFLEALVAKHQIFATVYDEQDGTTCQLLGQTTLRTEFTDATATTDPAHLLTAAEQSCFGPKFDLRNGPILRAHLVKLGDARYKWFFAVHHIAFDGASLALFVKELKSFIAQGTLDQLLTPSYADYAYWQRDSYDTSADLIYWQDRLNGAPAVHQLPLDRARPARQSFAGATTVQYLSHDMTLKLRGLSDATNSTEFATIFALFAAYLQLISGENDIVLGTPVANRQSAELEDIIGCFINTIPLRVKLISGESLMDMITRVNADLRDDLSHDSVPFEKLVQAVGVQRSFSHNPIFQIMIQLDNSESHNFQVKNTTFLTVQPIQSDAKFDLTLGIRLDEDFALSWNYATDLFDAKTIETMMAGFVTWVETCLASSGAPLPALEPAAQPKKIKGPIRESCTKRIADRFLTEADARPDQIALCDGSFELTYGQIKERAEILAAVLDDHKVGQDMLVGIYMDRSVDLVISMLACCLHGCAYLPLDPTYPQARTLNIIDVARPALVLCAGCFSDLSTAQFDVTHNRYKPARTSYSPLKDAQDTAYVIFTSGSTGHPKGVQVGHSSLTNFLDWMKDDLGMNAQSRVLQVTSISFDISVTEILAPLSLGGTIVLAPSITSSGINAVKGTIVESGVSVLQMVPGMLQALIDSAGSQQFPHITHLYCGGEAVPAGLLQAASDTFPNARIFSVYGPTEATVWASAYDFSARPTTGAIPLGQPASNSWLMLVDDDGLPVPQGRVGQLCIGGAALAKGYLKDPERTASAFGIDMRDGSRIYRTGDLARLTKDGQLMFVGRDDTQIKLRGHRIELGEIETALLVAGATSAACVLAEDKLTAFVNTETPRELREALADQLPDYMMPSNIVGIDSFPRTPSGKIDRRQLTQEAQRISFQTDDAPPVGETEETLTEIWKEILECDRIGRHQNFFEMGGHSLLAIRIMATVSTILEEDVPVRVLFANPNIADLATYIDEKVLGLSTKGQIS